jgi:hypothetical protein
MNFQNNKVYESPDGGKQIYEREIGSTERKLIIDNRTVDGRPLHEHLMESKLWGEIHRAAKTNKTLADILDQAKMVYALIKKETD